MMTGASKVHCLSRRSGGDGPGSTASPRSIAAAIDRNSCPNTWNHAGKDMHKQCIYNLSAWLRSVPAYA